MRKEYAARRRKLTSVQAKEIRARHAKGETQRELARAYGVTEGMVSAILAGTAHNPKGAPRAQAQEESRRVRTPGALLALRVLDALALLDNRGEDGATKEELGAACGDASDATMKRVLALIGSTEWALIVERNNGKGKNRYALAHYFDAVPKGWTPYTSIVAERAAERD